MNKLFNYIKLKWRNYKLRITLFLSDRRRHKKLKRFSNTYKKQGFKITKIKCPRV